MTQSEFFFIIIRYLFIASKEFAVIYYPQLNYDKFINDLNQIASTKN